MLSAVLFATAVRCTTPWFPPDVHSLRYKQTTTVKGLDDVTLTMEWKDIRIGRDEVRMTAITTKEGEEPTTVVKRFHCSAEGLTPVSDHVVMRGVQFGHNLAKGAEWKFTWSGTGIAASYIYTVEGQESVTVPAGTYTATRIRYFGVAMSETRGKLPTIRGTLWFVEGVGLVKSSEDDPALGLVPDQSTMVLIEKK